MMCIYIYIYIYTHIYMHTYIMEYYSSIKKKKKNKMLSFATLWRDLQSITLSETKRMTICFFLLFNKM